MYLYLLSLSSEPFSHWGFSSCFRRFLWTPPDKTDESPIGHNMPDLDYDSIDEIDDADDDSLHVLIKDKATDEYGWHWVYRDKLSEYGLHELARHGMFESEAAE
jgi:hypothetical protein